MKLLWPLKENYPNSQMLSSLRGPKKSLRNQKREIRRVLYKNCTNFRDDNKCIS